MSALEWTGEMDDDRKRRTKSTRRKGMPRLDAGQKVRDPRDSNVGVVLESACQYAHPKAQPVYSYMIRWQDGQVQAVSEAAFFGDSGLELVD